MSFYVALPYYYNECQNRHPREELSMNNFEKLARFICESDDAEMFDDLIMLATLCAEKGEKSFDHLETLAAQFPSLFNKPEVLKHSS